MNTSSFKFTEAAELYAKNFNVIQEMRYEAFRSIADFGEKLLQQLPIELGKEHLCQKKTVSQGTTAGVDLHYLWIGRDAKKEWEINTAVMISFKIPAPEKVFNEKQLQDWFGVFDVVTAHRINIQVYYEGATASVQDRIMSLIQDATIGELLKKDSRISKIGIDFDPENPVVSAAQRFVKLLRAIKEAENGKLT